MRNMSFALTTAQFRNTRPGVWPAERCAGKHPCKWVTRRSGWRFLKPGDHVRAVEKSMGLGKGGKIRPLGVIEIVSVSREALNAIDRRECIAEGFPELTPNRFVAMFTGHMGGRPDQIVTRIEFKRLPGAEVRR